jgi:hypothetical protein
VTDTPLYTGRTALMAKLTRELDDPMDDWRWPWCECNAEHDEEEIASNRCKACGKEID